MCTNDDENDKIKVGKLNLVDLAGSERQGKTGLDLYIHQYLL